MVCSDGEDEMRRGIYIHPWVWASLIGLLFWACVIAAISHGQTMNVDRKSTMSAVRDFINEPGTTYLPDSALVRIVNYSQQTLMLAMRERTSVIIDTFLTTTANLRYYLRDTKATSDTVMASRVAMVIQKASTASGGEEVALAYIPPDLVGRPQSGTVPAFYTVVGRELILGKSPLGGDTLFVYMTRVPRDLTADATALSVSKEDQPAVIYLSAALAMLRDRQIQAAQIYWQLWQAHTGFKGYPKMEEAAPTGP